MRDQSTLVLDGTSLTCDDVSGVARDGVPVALSDEGRQRARAAAEVAAYAAARRPVYGRTTGVGANHDQAVSSDDAARHGMRLVHSHAGGGGPLITAELGRAMLVVRVNQIAAGGSGVDPGVLDALIDAINGGLSVPVPVWGAIGTGDLTALAMTALCLLGERDWVPRADRPPRFALAAMDALAFLSSNAATIGEAALACSWWQRSRIWPSTLPPSRTPRRCMPPGPIRASRRSPRQCAGCWPVMPVLGHGSRIRTATGHCRRCTVRPRTRSGMPCRSSPSS